jgi:hypothetical protein
MNPLRGILRKIILFSIDMYALTGKSLSFRQFINYSYPELRLVAGDCGNPSLIPLLSGLLNKRIRERRMAYTELRRGTLNNKGFFPPHVLDF